jgi:hypothetical protein
MEGFALEEECGACLGSPNVRKANPKVKPCPGKVIPMLRTSLQYLGHCKDLSLFFLCQLHFYPVYIDRDSAF